MKVGGCSGDTEAGEESLGRFFSFVADIAATSLDGLFQAIYGEEAERDGFVVVQGELHERHAHGSVDVLVMGRFPANDSAEGDGAAAGPLAEELLDSEGEFPSSRHGDDQDVLIFDSRFQEGADGSVSQFAGNVIVVFGNDDGDAMRFDALGVHAMCEIKCLWHSLDSGFDRYEWGEGFTGVYQAGTLRWISSFASSERVAPSHRSGLIARGFFSRGRLAGTLPGRATLLPCAFRMR